MDSVWVKTAQRPFFDTLKGDIRTDVLIVGGGITGILCGYLLTKAGVDCIVVEADRICGGITKNTTAKITLQHGLIYDSLIRTYGQEKAQMYLAANRSALDKYRELCSRIDCDYQEMDSAVYSLKSRHEILREKAALERLGVPCTFEETLPIHLHIKGAVRTAHQAQFHPLKFMFAIAKELCIYENTKVLELLPGGAVTHAGRISADQIIVATHFPLINKHGCYFLKLYQHRSYVLALEGAEDVDGMYVDESDAGLSFRGYGQWLLLGGGGHRTGKKGGNWCELEAFARKYEPRAREVARWATQDCMTLDGIPYIGQYSPKTPNLYVATGFNKWGMSSAMAAAMILCQQVQGRKHDCAPVFSPSRSILHPQLAINALETTVNLLTPTLPRCPHMGCALKYNKQEHSWDCPCHGSRFTAEGRLIDNPATDDKRK